MKRLPLSLIITILIAICLRVVVAIVLGDQIEILPGIHDQISYHTLALSLSEGKGFQFPQAWYPFTAAQTPTAHWSFVYPLYLATLYELFGIHPLIPRLLQATIAGITYPFFLYQLGRTLFNERVASYSALAITLYPYFLYHNAALMTETFFITIILFLFFILYQTKTAPHKHHFWIFGVSAGIGILLRQTLLFFIPFTLLWLVVSTRGRDWQRWLVGTPLIIAICILPFTIRNYLHYHSFLLLNSNSGYALYSSNHPQHGTTWSADYTAPIPPELNGLNEAELDRALTKEAWGFITSQPWRILQLSISRLPHHIRFWPTAESNLLNEAVRFGSFGVGLPFMVWGIWLTRHRWRELIPFYALGIVMNGLHLLSWPGPRYRFPVDALWLLFAGVAVAQIASYFGRKQNELG